MAFDKEHLFCDRFKIPDIRYTIEFLLVTKKESQWDLGERRHHRPLIQSMFSIAAEKKTRYPSSDCACTNKMETSKDHQLLISLA